MWPDSEENPLYSTSGPDSEENPFHSTSGISSQSTGSVDLTEILLASHRATLHDFMALSYGPARAPEYDRQRGFRTWLTVMVATKGIFVWCALR